MILQLNYDSLATDDNGLVYYAVTNYGCNGDCLMILMDYGV